MHKKNVCVIYNPASGQGLPLPFLSKNLGIKKLLLSHLESPRQHMVRIERQLRALGMRADSVIASSAQEATQIARRCAKEKYSTVVAVGGDGTINAVINGLAGSTTRLGVIPLGSMNIYGIQMDLPIDLASACRRIAQSRTRSIDLGQVNQHYFACMAGIGFDAFVLNATDPFWKKTLGALAYLVVGLASLFFYPFRRIHFKVDGRPKIRTGYHIVVGNVKYYAGHILLLPRADMMDGRLDVVVFKRKNPWSVVRYALRLLLGIPSDPHDVEMFSCRTLEVVNRRQHVHVDGDYLGRLPVRIRIVPKALQVVV